MIKDTMQKLMPTCEEVTRLKSDSMDAKLSLRQRAAMKLHLMFCEYCRRYEKQLDMIRNVSKKYISTSENIRNGSNMTLSPEAKNKLKKLLED